MCNLIGSLQSVPFSCCYISTHHKPVADGFVNRTHTPVAFTKLENGWLGYIGDVGNVTESQKIVMEMCRFAASIAGSG